MFLRYLEPIFKPWRMMRNKITKVRTVKGNIKAEKNRVARFGNVAKGKIGAAKGAVGKAQAQGQQAQAQVQQAQAGAQNMRGQMPQGAPGMPGMPQGPGMPAQMQGAQAMNNPGAQGGFNPNPPIRTVGWFRKRKFCTQCEQQLDPTWDACPYCAQQAQQLAQQKPAAPQKTQAFMLDAAGAGSMQLLGWIVPLQGQQRGELFTLAPASVIGTDPTCNIVLNDQFMSSRHAEIRAEGGVWVLRDLGSTNGTFVNDKRVDQHELVDNDFVKFGKSVVKFKSL